MNPIPTESQISVYDSLDEQWAVKHFLGKSLEEAEALFRQNFLYYQEALMWMGPVAFAYYVKAAIRYLLGDDSDGDADAANTFHGLIRFRLDLEPESIRPVRPLLHSALIGIISKFDRFGCEPGIYGNLPNAYKILLEELSD